MRNFNTRAFRWARLDALVAFMLLAVTGPPGCTTANYKHTTETGPDGTRRTERSAGYTSLKGDASSAFDSVRGFVTDNAGWLIGALGTLGVGTPIAALITRLFSKNAAVSAQQKAAEAQAKIDAAWDEAHKLGLITAARVPPSGGAA